MANVQTQNALTFADATAANPKLIGEVFSQTVMQMSMSKDVFSMMEGPDGSNKPFLVNTDLAKTKGDAVNFTVASGVGKMPRMGEQTLLGKEEKVRLNSFQAKIDIFRHAFSANEKLLQFLAASKSFEAGMAKLSAPHFGRFKETHRKMALIKGVTEGNTIYPNSKGSINNLVSTDSIAPGVFDEAKSLLTGLGGKPIDIRKEETGAEILKFIMFGTEAGLRSLKSNSSYLQAVQTAGVRGDANSIFHGGYVDWNNDAIFPQNITYADADGATGDPLEQREFLGTAVTAGTAAFDITGGGVAGPTSDAGYFRWFEGFDYLFTEDQAAATPDSGTYYVVIYNTTGADRGKWGLYSYTGSANDGEKITTTQRLGSAASGTRVTTLAGVTWDGAVNTDAHPAGSIVIQVNNQCVPYCRGFALASAAMVTAYGSLGSMGANSFRPIKHIDDYGFTKGVGYMGAMGQAVCKDTQNQPRGYVMWAAAYNPPGVKNLPVVTDA